METRNPLADLSLTTAEALLHAEAAKQSRKIEALRLWEPQPWQQEFHACTARIAAILMANRSGKTATHMVEVARVLTGQDPYNKYPKENGTMVLIGRGWPHIGRVFHEYLFRAGAFKIIQDETTGEWRAFRPWTDEHLRGKEKPCPPLIPRRFWKNGSKAFTWLRRGSNIFSEFHSTTGWKLICVSSESNPDSAAGFQADYVGFDEDVVDDRWYSEMLARIMDRRGWLRWSALPLVENDSLMNLYNLAKEEEGREHPRFKVFRGTIFDNPFITAKDREELLMAWKAEGDEVLQQRAYGEVTLASVKMYPTWSDYTHSLRPQDADIRPGLEGVWQAYKDNGYTPPADWTRYAIVDPGFTVCCVEFVAVPPPQYGDFRIFYDELYIRECSAEKFAAGMSEKTQGYATEEFIIDFHGSERSSEATGHKIRRDYSDALKKRGVESIRTKHNFRDGMTDISVRCNRVRQWLAVREDGLPTMLVDREKCPNMIREKDGYKRKVERDEKGNRIVLDKPATRQPNHAMNCVEYAAGHGPSARHACAYVKPPKLVKKKTKSWLAREIELENRGRKQRGISLAPSGESK